MSGHGPMTATDNPEIDTAGTRSWSSHRRAPLAIFLVLAASLCSAADPATVTFSLDFPNSSPEHYSIEVQADRRAHYESTGKISTDSEARDNYQTNFTFSDATGARIFQLAAQAHYFSG